MHSNICSPGSSFGHKFGMPLSLEYEQKYQLNSETYSF